MFYTQQVILMRIMRTGNKQTSHYMGQSHTFFWRNHGQPDQFAKYQRQSITPES